MPKSSPGQREWDLTESRRKALGMDGGLVETTDSRTVSQVDHQRSPHMLVHVHFHEIRRIEAVEFINSNQVQQVLALSRCNSRLGNNRAIPPRPLSDLKTRRCRFA